MDSTYFYSGGWSIGTVINVWSNLNSQKRCYFTINYLPCVYLRATCYTLSAHMITVDDVRNDLINYLSSLIVMEPASKMRDLIHHALYQYIASINIGMGMELGEVIYCTRYSVEKHSKYPMVIFYMSNGSTRTERVKVGNSRRLAHVHAKQLYKSLIFADIFVQPHVGVECINVTFTVTNNNISVE